MTRREQAIDNFLKGYNCSQSVVLAFSDLLSIDQETLLKIASPFGGGMGRLREVCGSISGAFIVLGLLYGYDTPDTNELKKTLYSRVQEIAHQFEEKNGSIVCRELLGLNVKHDSATPSPRTEEFYKKRPCMELIGDAAEIVDAYILMHPLQK